MGDFEHVGSAARVPVLSSSPCYRRLAAEGYTSEDLERDVERWGHEVPDAYRTLYAAAKRFAERFGQESKTDNFEALALHEERLEAAASKTAAGAQARFRQTFDTLELRCRDEGVLEIAKRLRGMARNPDEAPAGLLIFGVPGTYKTWMCNALKAEAKKGGVGAVVYPVKQLVADVQRTYGGSGGSEEEVMRRVLDNRIVCLDDLGRERGTPDAGRIISDLVDELDRRRGRHLLVVTTNLTAEGLKHSYEPAMLSRLRGLCDQVVIEMGDTRGRDRTRTVLG